VCLVSAACQRAADEALADSTRAWERRLRDCEQGWRDKLQQTESTWGEGSTTAGAAQCFSEDVISVRVCDAAVATYTATQSLKAGQCI
jgi:hypothetical protein